MALKIILKNKRFGVIDDVVGVLSGWMGGYVGLNPRTKAGPHVGTHIVPWYVKPLSPSFGKPPFPLAQ